MNGKMGVLHVLIFWTQILSLSASLRTHGVDAILSFAINHAIHTVSSNILSSSSFVPPNAFVDASKYGSGATLQQEPPDKKADQTDCVFESSYYLIRVELLSPVS